MKSSISITNPDLERNESFNSSDSEMEHESRNCFQSLKARFSALLNNGLSGVVDEQILKEQQSRMLHNKLALLRIFLAIQSMIEMSKLIYNID